MSCQLFLKTLYTPFEILWPVTGSYDLIRWLHFTKFFPTTFNIACIIGYLSKMLYLMRVVKTYDCAKFNDLKICNTNKSNSLVKLIIFNWIFRLIKIVSQFKFKFIICKRYLFALYSKIEIILYFSLMLRQDSIINNLKLSNKW